MANSSKAKINVAGALEQAGWHLSAWCRAVNLSRATYYNIPEEMKPASVKIGDRRLIIESPANYLARIARLGGAVEIPRKAA